MMRILHIFGRMQRGGAEMRTLDLMRCMDRERFEFHFCALSGLPGSLDDEIRALGGEVHYCRLNWDFPFRFKHLLRQYKIDIVHSHVHYFSGFIVRQAAKANIPQRIVHFRSTQDEYGNSLRRKTQRYLMKLWIDRYATDILAVSEGVMCSAWELNWKSDARCRVIYNGIDLQPFQIVPGSQSVGHEFALPEKYKLYIHVGRMDKPKNHERLIDIFAELHKQQPNAYLLLVGREKEPIEAKIRQKIEALNLAEHVRFAGERSDVCRLLHAADCMIFPSLWEGLPGAVLEACAAGTPVLASSLPGIIEISERLPSVHCLNLEVDDTEWARAAQNLVEEYSNPVKREAAKRHFAQSVFSIENSLREYQDVWISSLVAN